MTTIFLDEVKHRAGPSSTGHFLAFLALALLAIAFPASAAPPSKCAVEYRFTARWDQQPRRFDVDVLFDAGARTATVLRVAEQWGPVSDFGRAIANVRPIAPSAVVSPGPEAARSWRIDHPAGVRVHVRYEMRNDVPDVDAATPRSHETFYRTQLGERWFQFYGWGGLLVPEGIDPETPASTCIRFEGIPGAWRFASSQGEGRRHGRTIEIHATTSLHALMGSMFLGGDFRVYRREIEGGPLVMALRGQWRFADPKLVDMTARIIATHRAFWRDGFPHYLISLLPNHVKTGETGGTALYRAFAMYACDDFAVPGAAFDHLIGHEDMHTWIPQRIGASGVDEAQRYWFSEGFTDYLAHRLLLTAGAWTLDDYAAHLDATILAYEASPMRNAPNRVLARDFWKDVYDAQRMAYMRGELLALYWNREMASRGASLQAALRSLLLPKEAAMEGKPEDLAASRLLAALRPALGPALDRDVEHLVDEGRTIPIGSDFLGPCFDAKRVTRPRFELGFDFQASRAARAVRGLTAGSAAENAGLREGMKIAGLSIAFGATDKEVVLHVVEGGREREIRYLPRAAQGIEVLDFSPRAGAKADEACRAWIEAR
jgi:predicted metalloprotease with PDZ domain